MSSAAAERQIHAPQKDCAISAQEQLRAAFLQALNATAERKAPDSELTLALRRALLAFGSETPDNRACAERLEIREEGPALVGGAESFADISWSLEDGPMPPQIAQNHPDLSEQDWAAFTRLTSLIYAALTR